MMQEACRDLLIPQITSQNFNLNPYTKGRIHLLQLWKSLDWSIQRFIRCKFQYLTISYLYLHKDTVIGGHAHKEFAKIILHDSFPAWKPPILLKNH